MDRRDFLTRMALRLGPALLIIISFMAVMLGIIMHAISINEIEYKSPPATHFDSSVIIDDKPTDLVWFLQVTDLHLSVRGDFEREKDFARFAQEYVTHIKPDAVLVTGDITDGRVPNSTFGTSPQLAEWVAYSSAIERSGALNKTLWLDVRGNHDNFNVFRPQDPNTLYRKYSIQGKNHSRNYLVNLEKNGKKYAFIGVDEVQTPGLKVPFNFIGIVKSEDIAELKRFKELAKADKSEFTVWFAHYPTSSIASPGEGLRNIIDGPYLCGHFHTIGNLVAQMHATQQPGFAEIELGDWKYNRRIRLASIDHQLFNFVDVGLDEFPIALMTNPKKAEFLMPKFEPVNRIENSTHIRVIAFSNAPIDLVEISIDGGERKPMKRVEDGPLYVRKWDPADYSAGLHSVDIFVRDEKGSNRTYTQSFSLDGSKGQFGLGARILLRAYYKSYVMAMFYFAVVVCTLPILILRILVFRHQETGLRRHYRGTFLHSLHLLSNIRSLFTPLFIIPLWLAIGPHFVGRLVDEAVGVCFVWGILIDGTFIHTGLTYNVGSLYLLFVHIPIVILLAYQVGYSYRTITSASKPISIINLRLLVYIVVTVLQMCMGSLLYSAYGTMALLTSFPFVWCIPIYVYCWYQCTLITSENFEKSSSQDRPEEQRALTGQRARDDKSSASDQSTC